MISRLVATLALGLGMPALALAADPKPQPQPQPQGQAAMALVICAPGFPGSTAEAQPTIDALVAAIASAAKLPAKELTGAYYETEKGGMTRLSQPDAALALVPTPFFLEHADELKLKPRLAAVFKGKKEPVEVWTLFAKKGSLPTPEALDGWQIASTVSYSPRFIKGPVLGGWGKLPEGVKLTQTKQSLSSLRKAAAGEKIAVLLGEEDAAQVSTLAFAADLEPVYKSGPVPFGVLATVEGRITEARWKALAPALLKLDDTPEGAKAAKAVWDLKFMPLDEKALAAAQKAFQAAAK